MHLSELIHDEISCMSSERNNDITTPQKDDILYCKNDYHSEALDKHAVGIYKEVGFVGHVWIERSRIISYFLQESETNE